jgi:8-oxo-dGTP diphosphatase
MSDFENLDGKNVAKTLANIEDPASREQVKNARSKNYNIYQIPLENFFQTAFSVDCVVYGFDGDDLKILLIQRGAEPFKDQWALPGDLVYPDEDLDASANRILRELTGLSKVFMEQHRTYGRVNRHPLGRVVTTSYYSLVNLRQFNPESHSWAVNAHWHSLNDIPDLAFDHNEVLTRASEELQTRVRTKPIGFELLSTLFPLNALQQLYEAILGMKFDKANFRKKILSMDLLIDTGKQEKDVPHRPARLYSFDKERYDELISKGFSFEL